MVCSRSSRRASRRKRLGASLVSAQAPPGGRRVVDGPADERVAEPKSSRHLGDPEEIELQELVDRLDHRSLRLLRGHCCQLGLERITGHCCSLQHGAGGIGEQGEFLDERRNDRRGDAKAHERRLVTFGGRVGGRDCRSSELLEIEGVPAALLVESGGICGCDRLPEELPRFTGRERLELDAGQRAGAVRTLQRRLRAARPCRVGDARAP